MKPLILIAFLLLAPVSGCSVEPPVTFQTIREIREEIQATQKCLGIQCAWDMDTRPMEYVCREVK